MSTPTPQLGGQGSRVSEGHLSTQGTSLINCNLQILQPRLLSAPPLSRASQQCTRASREGGISLCSRLGETTSPSLLIKFPSPYASVAPADKPHCRQVGRTRAAGRAPSLHLHWEGRAPLKGPGRSPSCLPTTPRPRRAAAAPFKGWAPTAAGRVRAGCLAFLPLL